MLLLPDCSFQTVGYLFDQNNNKNIKQKVNEFIELKKHKGIEGIVNYLKLRFK